MSLPWRFSKSSRDEQRQRLSEVQKAFNSCALNALSEGCDVGDLLRSPVEIQCELALELLSEGAHPKGVVAVFRDATVPDSQSQLMKLAYNRLKNLRKKIEDAVPPENIITLQSSSTDSSRTDPPSESEERLAPFRERVLAALSALLDESLSTEPDQGKGRKKTVQEVFLEHITHLRICIDHNRLCKINVKEVEDVAKSILNNIKDNYENKSKHPPVLIYGPDASGKTTLLTHLYFKCEEIFSKPLLRIIRFSASTPRSAYNLELLRVMCQQISIILNIPEGYLPKDASFDPLYINNWFQSLLKRCEDMENETLLIFIDNVHRVNPLECDIVTGLSWLPMSLPKNVFLVCTSAVPLEQLQLTPAQKEKFRAQNCYCSLDAIDGTPENKSCADYIDGAFDKLEVVFGSKAFSKLAGYITCSEFGLTELELLELLMPTSNSEAVISLEDANFNFSTLCVAKNMMEPLLLENVVSGRMTWRWRAAAAGARARRRYVRVQSALRDAHSDLAALHFANFLADADDTDTEEAQELGCADDDDALLDSTPFHWRARPLLSRNGIAEEAWLHLLLAGDFAKLKDPTVCNFDFLLAAVQTVTISYLRCILEHVRCYILDRDVELVYGAVRKASDILTRDPMQLGAQIIAWLRPAVARRGVLATLVTSAMAWCDGYDKPLLVPLNGCSPRLEHSLSRGHLNHSFGIPEDGAGGGARLFARGARYEVTNWADVTGHTRTKGRLPRRPQRQGRTVDAYTACFSYIYKISISSLRSRKALQPRQSHRFHLSVLKEKNRKILIKVDLWIPHGKQHPLQCLVPVAPAPAPAPAAALSARGSRGSRRALEGAPESGGDSERETNS
ncbi:NACHT and WD repeat domain-containing protein 2 [Eumeta japonica]|uniref:NACHT and WD repeat domain-containing protein 2 n=1 Tax=Eumeta variegata TaxID=151549 RepID=A0A4C1XBW1_EUMVA|nr:NACHT and WD repeat domain-containing protein 2 [Eumeta japonica]